MQEEFVVPKDSQSILDSVCSGESIVILVTHSFLSNEKSVFPFCLILFHLGDKLFQVDINAAQ